MAAARTLDEAADADAAPIDTNTPRSVATTRWPSCSTVQLAGTSGRFPEMSLNVAPASWDTKTWPVPTWLVSSPSAPGGTQRRPYPPSVTYTVLGSAGSIFTDVM